MLTAIREFLATIKIKQLVYGGKTRDGGLRWDAWLLSAVNDTSKRNQHYLAMELLRWMPDRTLAYTELKGVVEYRQSEWDMSDESGWLLETEMGDLEPGKKLSATQMLKFWKEYQESPCAMIYLYD